MSYRVQFLTQDGHPELSPENFPTIKEAIARAHDLIAEADISLRPEGFRVLDAGGHEVHVWTFADGSQGT
jgi:hypothetical protein